jgi:hypothetical protein
MQLTRCHHGADRVQILVLRMCII